MIAAYPTGTAYVVRSTALHETLLPTGKAVVPVVWQDSSP